jgi:hypothetical protein
MNCARSSAFSTDIGSKLIFAQRAIRCVEITFAFVNFIFTQALSRSAAMAGFAAKMAAQCRLSCLDPICN